VAFSIGALTSNVSNPGGIAQESVIAPTLLNSWVNYGSTFATAGYWKDSCGVVHIQGMIKSGTTTAGTVFFTLPSGYRPTADQIFPTESVSAYAGVTVDSSGNVSARAGCNNVYQTLNGISFRAA
jgi:hypothetical protein